MKETKYQEICDICQGHEYMEDHFIKVEFLPEDRFLPSMVVPVHRSHFNEIYDGAKEVYRGKGKYVIN